MGSCCARSELRSGVDGAGSVLGRGGGDSNDNSGHDGIHSRLTPAVALPGGGTSSCGDAGNDSSNTALPVVPVTLQGTTTTIATAIQIGSSTSKTTGETTQYSTEHFQRSPGSPGLASNNCYSNHHHHHHQLPSTSRDNAPCAHTSNSSDVNMPIGATELCTLQAHTSDVNGVAFSASALASCGGDKEVRLWAIPGFSELGYSPLTGGHKYSINGCTFSPDGALLVSYSTDGKAVLWDPKAGEQVGVLAHPSQASIKVCRFNATGDMAVTGSDDETMCLWDVASRKLIRLYEGHEASVPAVAFCPGSQFLVCGNVLGYLKVFDACGRTSQQLWYEMNAHDLGVTCCNFSPTYGTAGEKLSADAPKVHYLLATCGYDNNIKLWDFVALIDSISVTLTLRNTLSGHNDSVMDCSFSPDGQLVASAAGDKTVRLWDPIQGQHVYTILGHSRFVTCCCFSMDGRYLASGSNDRSIKVWRIARTDQLRQESKQLEVMRPQCETTAKHSSPPRTAYYMKNVGDWGVEEVCQWLADLGMPQYVSQFRHHAIDGIELLTLNNDSLEKNFSIMVLGHRNKLARAIEDLREQPARQVHAAANGMPDEFLCPITREIMADPVIASDGFTYERMAITDWMTRGKRYSPMTNSPLASTSLTPNRNVKMLIQRHLQEAK